MLPLLIVHEINRQRLEQIRKGLSGEGLVVLGFKQELWSVPGLDAIFLTLPRSEAWGSKPLRPHLCEVLRTPDAERRNGWPAFAVTGVVLTEEDPKTPEFVLPLVVKSAVKAARSFNESHGAPILTLGLDGLDRFAPGIDGFEIGRLLLVGYHDAASD
jgi:hypothetical protein